MAPDLISSLPRKRREILEEEGGARQGVRGLEEWGSREAREHLLLRKRG